MYKKSTSRREVIAGAGAAACAALATGCSAGPDTDNDLKEYPDLYDFSKYEDNLEAFVKIMADTSGKATYISAQGRIYAVRPGEMAFPLCSTMGFRYAKLIKTEIGYRHYTRDWAFVCDLETGKPIDKFENPLTGEIVDVKHTLTRLYNWEWTPDGQKIEGYPNTQAWLRTRPLKFPFSRNGDEIRTSLELLAKYGPGLAGAEFMHFLVDANDLNNPNLTSAPFQLSWIGDSAWMRWLNMGNIQGRTSWQSMGRKYHDISDLSPEIHSAAEKYFPGSLAAVETYEKASYSTAPGTEDIQTTKDRNKRE